MSYPPAATLPSPRAVAAAAATAAYFLFGPCNILPFHPFFFGSCFCLSRLDFATAYSIDFFVLLLLLLVVRALRLKFEIERVRDRGSDCGCLWFLALSPFLSLRNSEAPLGLSETGFYFIDFVLIELTDLI